MVLVLTIGDLHIPSRATALPAKFKKLLVPGKIAKILVTGNLCGAETVAYLRSVSGDVVLVRGDCDDPLVAEKQSAVVEVGGLRIGVVHGDQVVPAGDRRALAAVARSLDCDVLVSGHTHAFEAFESEGRFYLNPGSATGAFSHVKPMVRVPLVQEVAQPEPAEKPTPESAEADEAESESKDDVEPKAEETKENPDTQIKRTHKLVSDVIPSFALLDVQGLTVVVYVYKLIDGDVKVEKLEFSKKV
ncbi:Vacuolar protein sorting-associated protein 29 [Podochytrium sp. JEL0797]|nr:Vacuolar protein sorting-associated protein 29 [Podochytrium sp. JEL0797]